MQCMMGYMLGYCISNVQSSLFNKPTFRRCFPVSPITVRWRQRWCKSPAVTDFMRRDVKYKIKPLSATQPELLGKVCRWGSSHSFSKQKYELTFYCTSPRFSRGKNIDLIFTTHRALVTFWVKTTDPLKKTNTPTPEWWTLGRGWYLLL